jgi:predicted amidophosphoribosyltransferase
MLPLHWFLLTPCPLCRSPRPHPATPARACAACEERYGLPAWGLSGLEPLPWWGAGTYAAELRQLLLELRRHPRPEAVAALALASHRALTAYRPAAAEERPWLVPVPSWKKRANPLPPLVCRALEQRTGLRRGALLERSRPVLGQHRLGRALRIANQEGAVLCRRPPGPGEARRHPLLIVDDILTSGATARSAAASLTAAGWRVIGLLCLARTPAREPVQRGARAGGLASTSPLVP